MDIKSILQEMSDVVKNQETKTPDYWIDKAIQLTVLWAELKEAMLNAEIEYNQEIAKRIEVGEKVNQAERMVKANSNKYKIYQYLVGRDRVIKEFIMIAKKRAQIDREYNY